MSNNITLKKITRDSGAYEAGVTFETEQQAGGEHRPVVKVGASDLPAGAATEQGLDDLLTELRLKADLTETQPVSAASLPLPSGAATAAAQTDGSQRAGILGFRSSDSSYQPLRLDKATNSIQTIDYSHHEAHAGSAYYYHDVIALANGAAQDYLLTTANTTTWPHIGFEVDLNDGAGTMELYEAADRAGTTLQTTFNRDRNSTNTAGMTIHKGQSGGTTDGSRILWKRDGTGKTAGGTSGTAEERILKQNTKYILRITNVAGAGVTNNITVIVRWYEHANLA